jgi:hypothetical protein
MIYRVLRFDKSLFQCFITRKVDLVIQIRRHVKIKSSFNSSDHSFFCFLIKTMTSISNSNLLRVRRTLIVRWKNENILLIVQWLFTRDEDDNFINLSVYLKKNKIKTCRKLMTNSELNTQRSDISKKKHETRLLRWLRCSRILKLLQISRDEK